MACLHRTPPSSTTHYLQLVHCPKPHPRCTHIRVLPLWLDEQRVVERVCHVRLILIILIACYSAGACTRGSQRASGGPKGGGIARALLPRVHDARIKGRPLARRPRLLALDDVLVHDDGGAPQGVVKVRARHRGALWLEGCESLGNRSIGSTLRHSRRVLLASRNEALVIVWRWVRF